MNKITILPTICRALYNFFPLLINAVTTKQKNPGVIFNSIPAFPSHDWQVPTVLPHNTSPAAGRRQILAHPCAQQSSQQPKGGNNPNVPQHTRQMNEWTKCCLHTQQNTIQPEKGRKFWCYSVDEPWRRDEKWKTPDTKRHVSYDTPHVRYLERSNSQRQKVG